MILIDLGNTNAKIFDDRKVIKIASNTICEHLEKYESREVLISSVVPSLTKKIKTRYPNVNFVEPENYELMFEHSGELNTKGADRIIAAFGAVKLYGPKVVVCDIGTCVTLDVLDNKRYISGLIYPGFVMLENLLNEKIEQLPAPKPGTDHISTANQIYWANIYGFIGALVKMVEISMIDDDFQLVITGGSVLKLEEEYGVNILEYLKEYNPIFDSQLIKHGLEHYTKKKATV